MRSPPAIVSVLALLLVGCDSSSSNPASPVFVEESSKDLGATSVGATLMPPPVVVHNPTAGDVEIRDVILKGPDSNDFRLVLPTLPLTLRPGESTTVAIEFTPLGAGIREAQLCVVLQPLGQPEATDTVELSGGGLAHILTGPDLVLNPTGATPLAALLELETDVQTEVRVHLDDGADVRTLPQTSRGTQHELPVLGLRAATTYTVTVEVATLDGVVRTIGPLGLTTDPLPPSFPHADILISEVDRMEPGVILFGAQCNPTSYLIALDETGEVVWFLQGELARTNDLRRASNGLLLGVGRRLIYEFDMLGRVATTWSSLTANNPPAAAIPVQTDSFHHEVYEMPSGNLLTLSREKRTVTAFPSSDTDPLAPRITKEITGDLVVELRRDGTIERSWSLLDVLDPRRIGYNAVGGDWSHSNGVIYDERDDSYIVSVRHQDCLVKLDRSTGSLIWILGTPDNWGVPWSDRLLQAAPGLSWPFHPHAPMLTRAGNLLLFDNGNHRTSPFDPPVNPASSHSRAVIYAIDGGGTRVEEIWRYGGPGDELFYSAAVSDADELPQTGNILVTDGFKIFPTPMRRSARLVEVTRTTPPVKVFEALYDDPTGTMSCIIYRAEKLPDLYP